MITYYILGFTVIFSLIGFRDKAFFAKYMFNPNRINSNKKEWYTIFTHAFLHVDYMHLFQNMLVLFFFGLPLEQEIFPFYFPAHARYFYLVLYFGGIVVSSVPAYEKHKHNPMYSAVGASGAIFAVLFSYILINPTAMLQIMFLPIPIPAFVLGILYLGYEWYMSKRGRTNIGHDAHLWGGIFGLVFTTSLHYQFAPGFYNQIVTLLHHE
ncbi:MAG TPA: rhomboid family intramembrane serine protease [Bacteroidia bacterium]|jgi:membrane associated rhomboid family serine protease|nr:rhomboid family intramembrane serine protease [Bacteroidia bacterium]